MRGKDWKCKEGEVPDGARSQRCQELGENRITEREEEGLASEQEKDPTSDSKRGHNEDAQHFLVEERNEGHFSFSSFCSLRRLEDLTHLMPVPRGEWRRFRAVTLGLSTKGHSGS